MAVIAQGSLQAPRNVAVSWALNVATAWGGVGGGGGHVCAERDIDESQTR